MPQFDRNRCDVQLATESLSDGFERRFELRLTQQTEHVIQHDRFALSLPGFLRPLTLASRELAGDDRGQQEEHERDPLFWIGHRQLVQRLNEKPVKDQERKYRRKHRRTAAKSDRSRHHGEQIQHRYIGQIDLA